MKKTLWFLGGFVAGAAVAGVAVWFALLRPIGHGAMRVHAQAVEGRVDAALALRSGTQEKFLRSFELNLAQDAASLHALGDRDYTRHALWRIQDYYAVTGITPPSEVATILSGLPPRPPG